MARATAGTQRSSLKSYVDFSKILKKMKHKNVPPEIGNWLPTGLTLLDAMHGNGLAGGRWAMVHGEDNVFKSSFTYHIAGICQELGGAVWIDDPEDKFNAGSARINGLRFGADDDRGSFYYTQTESAEEHIALFNNWVEISRESEVPMLAIYDSLGAMSTKQQQSTDTEHPMSVAKTLSSWLAKGPLKNLSNSKLFVLWVNQQRDGVDFFSYGPPKPKLPGGRASKYKTSTRIKMSTQALSQNDKDKEMMAPIGKQVRFTVEKSCAGPDTRWCLVPYFYHFGFDDALSCLNYLISTRYLTKGTEDGTKLKYGINNTYHSKGEWRQLFYADKGVAKEIRSMARTAYLRENTYQGGEAASCEDEE